MLALGAAKGALWLRRYLPIADRAEFSVSSVAPVTVADGGSSVTEAEGTTDLRVASTLRAHPAQVIPVTVYWIMGLIYCGGGPVTRLMLWVPVNLVGESGGMV